jgi:hypothetical protein
MCRVLFFNTYKENGQTPLKEPAHLNLIFNLFFPVMLFFPGIYEKYIEHRQKLPTITNLRIVPIYRH